ncbi:MAG: Uma2 family endonuclease [Planctomycetes bacterium]|nr:Uma2 family endonuclease [Planctomycetota bacterium]
MAIVAEERPTLETGDNLTRDEFLRIWEQLPHIKYAELIGGIVYMPAALGTDHGGDDFSITTWLGVYSAATPGSLGGSNVTCIFLGDCPQPDVNLRVVTECGGRSWTEDERIHGSPELLTEVCNSTEAMDLHQKFELYKEAKIAEYLVVVVKRKEIRWHRLIRGQYKRIAPDESGIYRSVVFPGLWLDSKALFKNDLAQVLATLQQGITSDEHQAFVEDLARRKRKAKS